MFFTISRHVFGLKKNPFFQGLFIIFVLLFIVKSRYKCVFSLFFTHLIFDMSYHLDWSTFSCTWKCHYFTTFISHPRNFRRKVQGRMRKHLADLNLIAGMTNEAYSHYQSAMEILKGANDWLWIGGKYYTILSTHWFGKNISRYRAHIWCIVGMKRTKSVPLTFPPCIILEISDMVYSQITIVFFKTLLFILMLHWIQLEYFYLINLMTFIIILKWEQEIHVLFKRYKNQTWIHFQVIHYIFTTKKAFNTDI